MATVATVPVDDITEWYEDDGVPHVNALPDDEKESIIELCWKENLKDTEQAVWESLQEAIQERADWERDRDQ